MEVYFHFDFSTQRYKCLQQRVCSLSLSSAHIHSLTFSLSSLITFSVFLLFPLYFHAYSHTHIYTHSRTHAHTLQVLQGHRPFALCYIFGRIRELTGLQFSKQTKCKLAEKVSLSLSLSLSLFLSFSLSFSLSLSLFISSPSSSLFYPSLNAVSYSHARSILTFLGEMEPAGAF